MEWTFAAKAKLPSSSLEPFITHFKQLERELQEISRISVTEPTLCNYEMLCVQTNKLTVSDVNVWQALLLIFLLLEIFNTAVKFQKPQWCIQFSFVGYMSSMYEHCTFSRDG